MVEMSKKKMGENPNIPYPHCGRSINTLLSTRIMPLGHRELDPLWPDSRGWGMVKKGCWCT